MPVLNTSTTYAESEHSEGDSATSTTSLLDASTNEIPKPQISPLFVEQDEKESEQNHNTEASEIMDVENFNEELLRRYIHKHFDFRSDNTIRYTKEQRDDVFDFVKECATNQDIRQSVCFGCFFFLKKISKTQVKKISLKIKIYKIFNLHKKSCIVISGIFV